MRVVGLGALDGRDGRLHLTGGEYMPWVEEEPGTLVDVPRGHLAVSLLEVGIPEDRASWQAAAIDVRLRPGTPVRWVQQRGGPGSDAATFAVAGRVSAARLAKARTSDEALGELRSAP